MEGPTPAEGEPTPARVRWIGHSTVLISVDGVRLLTDPLLRVLVAHLRRRVPVHPDALKPVDAVLLSHAHHDHLDFRSLQPGRPCDPGRRPSRARGAASASRLH